MAKHTQKAVKEIKTYGGKWGEVKFAEYVYCGVNLRHEEITLKQQNAITPILIDAGIAEIASFADVASVNIEQVASQLLVSGKAVDFLLVVLKREDGDELTADFLSDAPSAAFNELFGEALGDFFFMNPSLLSRVVIPYAQSLMTRDVIRQIKNSATTSVAENLTDSRES